MGACKSLSAQSIPNAVRVKRQLSPSLAISISFLAFNHGRTWSHSLAVGAVNHG